MEALRLQGTLGRRPNRLALALLALATLCTLAIAGRPTTAGLPTSVEPAAAPSDIRPPLAFVPNRGQAGEGVRFQGRAPGLEVLARRDELALALGTDETARLALRFLDASSHASVSASDRLRGKVNYLRGDDPAKWQRNLPTFAELRYQELWPGIDMVVRGTGGALKYEFHLEPGARVADIALAYAGAAGLAVSETGALVVQTAAGQLRDQRPRTYQRSGGRRVPVESRFALGTSGARSYGFEVARYDRTRPLVIDPGIEYSTLLGGAGLDNGEAIAVDGEANAYITGRAGSSGPFAGFPTTPGAFSESSNGNSEAYITKLDPSGSELVYSTFIGGPQADFGKGIAVDGEGSAYVAGETGTGFPTTPAAADPTHNGAFDAFVAKLSPDGSALEYSTYLGGDSQDGALAIALDETGSAYVTGSTESADFPTTPSAYDRQFNEPFDDRDAFVAKLSPDGSALEYSTYLGGSSDENSFDSSGIAVDGSGSAYVTGNTFSLNFPTTPGAFDRELGADVYVTKLNPTGSDLVYSTALGGTSDDRGSGIAVDSEGNAYVTGETGPNFPTTPGAYDTTFASGSDAFITKLNPTGSGLVYSTYLGGTRSENGFGEGAIAVDSVGSAYVTGDTESREFPTTPDAHDPTLSDLDDGFVSKLDPSGARLEYSSYHGSNQSDNRFGAGVTVDDAGNVYLTGDTEGADFPTTPNAFDTEHNGFGDVFVTKLALGPRRSDYKNASHFCKAEREFLGEERFRQRYDAGANAHGKCVSTN